MMKYDVYKVTIYLPKEESDPDIRFDFFWTFHCNDGSPK